MTPKNYIKVQMIRQSLEQNLQYAQDVIVTTLDTCGAYE